MRKTGKCAWILFLILTMCTVLLHRTAVSAEADGVAVGVQIVWNDDEDAAGQRPEELALQLLKNGARYGDPVKVTGESWYAGFSNLPKGYDEQKKVDIDYQVAVVGGLGEHYFEEARSDDGRDITIELKYDADGTLGNHTVKAEVIFDDRDNKDKSRPERTWLVLTRNGTPFSYPAEVSAETKWKCEWKNLPAAGEYRISHPTVPDGYEVNAEAVDGGSFRVRYSHKPKPEKTSVKAEIRWDDECNADNVRPKSLHLQLMKDDKPEGNPVEVNDGTIWNAVWEDLPAEDETGKKISYRVKVTDLPKEYGVDISGDQKKGYSITAKHTVYRKINISAKMRWDDADNRAQKRPAIVHLQLMKGGQPQGDPVSLSDADNWTGSWPNISFRPSAKDGDGDFYSMKVTDNPAEYGFEISGDAEHGYQVTGRYTPELEPTNTPVPTPTPTLTPAQEEQVKMEGLKPVTILTFVLAALLAGMLVLLIVLLVRKGIQEKREEETAEEEEDDDRYEDEYDEDMSFRPRRRYGSRDDGSPYGSSDRIGSDGNRYGNYTVYGSREEYGDRYGDLSGEEDAEDEEDLIGDDYDFGRPYGKRKKK